MKISKFFVVLFSLVFLILGNAHAKGFFKKKIPLSVKVLGTLTVAGLYLKSHKEKSAEGGFGDMNSSGNSANDFYENEESPEDSFMCSTSAAQTELKANLNRDRLAQGLIEIKKNDGSGCAAHHIVAETASNVKNFGNVVISSRRMIQNCGIGLNSSENGIFLPYKNPSQCTGTFHPTLHTFGYYNEVYQRLNNTLANGGCSAMRMELSNIKQELANGRIFP